MESSINFKKVNSVEPAAPWVGGKRRLARRIIERIKEVPHKIYIEPFVGMGGIFLRRDFAVECEIINDFDCELINLFRVIQRHENALIDMLKWRITSRDEFERLRQAVPETLTDLERAARFLYLQRTVFGGSPGGTFGMSLRTARFDTQKLFPVLMDIHDRLARVVIECLPWQKVIEKYDRAETLFYLDPPYYGTEDYYSAPFKRSEFEDIAERLRRLNGRFILSLNDCEAVREIFKGFAFEEVKVGYSLASKGSARGQRAELIISN